MKIGNQQRNNNLIKDINIIIDLYSAGYSQQQLGKIYNVSNSTIRYYLLKNNIKIRNLKESCYKIRKKKNIYIDTFFSENLIGWLLGDGGLRKCNRSTNPHFVYTDKKYSNIKILGNNSNIHQLIKFPRKKIERWNTFSRTNAGDGIFLFDALVSKQFNDSESIKNIENEVLL